MGLSCYSYRTFSLPCTIALDQAGWGVTWSLALEEQFYLLIPLVIRRLSHSNLIKFTIGVILIAPALRMMLTHLGVTAYAGYTLLPCRGDSLGLGLLVAIACRNENAWRWLSAHRKLVFVAFLILGFGLLVWTVRDVQLGYTWTAAFYACLLLLVVVKPGRIERGVFRNAVLLKFGTIAYGVYLFHSGVLHLYHYAVFGTDPSVQNWSTLFVTIVSLLTVVALAELSWRFFEKPLIIRAHLRYQYRKVVGPESAGGRGRISITTTSGLSASAKATAALPSSASPTVARSE